MPSPGLLHKEEALSVGPIDAGRSDGMALEKWLLDLMLTDSLWPLGGWFREWLPGLHTHCPGLRICGATKVDYQELGCEREDERRDNVGAQSADARV